MRGFVVVVGAVAIGVVMGSCAKPAPPQPPYYGSLTPEERRLQFAHDIEVLEVANGMRVALLRDTRTNLVTVDMRYLVGLADDPPGRAGLAHLVEHLAFEPRAVRGGPTLGNELAEVTFYQNASTTPDETHYTATAPAERLDAVLALEARRMRMTCDQLDDATFARERDVVLAEELQRATPRDPTTRALYALLYGEAHPYTRSYHRGEVAAATRAEVCAFLALHYTPERAILVVTGPIDVRATAARIGALFGPIPTGVGMRARIAPPAFAKRRLARTGAVEHPTVLIAFARQPWGEAGRAANDLIDEELELELEQAARGKRWIRSTSLSSLGDGRAPAAVIRVELEDAARADDAAKLVFEAAYNLEVKRQMPELLMIQPDARGSSLLVAWDRLETRGARIADYLASTTHGWFMLKDLAELRQMTDRELRARVRTITEDTVAIAVITPDRATATTAGTLALPPLRGHDLATWRAPVDPAEAGRPLAAAPDRISARVEAFELGNGLRVIFAPDRRSPIVDARLVFPAGSAHEPADRPGLATAAALLLGGDYRGLDSYPALRRLQWALRTGTLTDTEVDETTTTFGVRGLAHYADWHVWRLAWQLGQGWYEPRRLEKLRDVLRSSAGSAQTRSTRADAADRLRFRTRLFGAGHPYATAPYEPRALLAIDQGDLERWRAGRFSARGATLIVSGGFEPARLHVVVRELFGRLAAPPPAPLPAIPGPTPPRAPSYLAAPDPDRAQARLAIGFAAPPERIGTEAARRVLLRILEDRVRSVRESMGASYGLAVGYAGGAAGSALLITGEVDPARAGDALVSVLDELAALRAGGPGFTLDFVRARRRALAAALAVGGGAAATAEMLERLAARGLPLDREAEVAAQIARLTVAEVAAVAAADLAAARMVVQVAARPAVVDAAFRRLGVRPE